jgi:glyoxylase-like metal-dependent hydrolase (beta-lactamase superfamily II)
MSIQIGNAEVLRVEELTQPLPMAPYTRDLAFAEALAKELGGPAWFDPATGAFTLIYQSWILRRDGLTIVIDPCNGNGRSMPLVPQLNQLDTPFLERFEAAGVRPEDVDLVFCTHLHCDHCGWNTRLSGGRFVPTFPNARYVFVHREVERWDPRLPDHRVTAWNETVFEVSVRPILDAGLARLAADTDLLAPGLHIEPGWGHSAGHSVLRVETGAQEAWFTGDIFNHPVQIVRPELDSAGAADDPQLAEATRRRVCEAVARAGALLLPAHFPAPHAGWIEARGSGFGFVPYLAR